MASHAMNPYHYVAGALAILAILGMAARWHHRREQTTARTAALEDGMRDVRKSVDAVAGDLGDFKVKVAEEYIHRADYVVMWTRMDHKIDKILEIMAGLRNN